VLPSIPPRARRIISMATGCVTLAGLVVLPAWAAALDLTWSTKASLPVQIEVGAAAEAGGALYSIGGDTGVYSSATAAMNVYDPVTNTWAARAPMSAPRTYFSAVGVSGIIYVIGGNDITGTLVATMEAYDSGANTWSPKASMPTTARDQFAVAAVGGVIYAFGGRNPGGSDLALVEAYDAGSNTWTTKASMPTPRYNLTATAVDGVIYAMGGLHAGAELTTVEAYDTASNSWTARASLPIPLHFATACASGGRIYIVGGWSGPSYLASVEVFDPSTDSWTTASPMPTARYAGASAVVGNLDYVLGGDGPATLATVEVATLPLMGPLPSAGRIQIRGNVIRVAEHGVATIVAHGKPGGNAVLVLYSQSGVPVFRLNQNGALDSTGVLAVAFDGRIAGKPLTSGVYYVLSSGDVTDRQPLLIVTTGNDLQ